MRLRWALIIVLLLAAHVAAADEFVNVKLIADVDGIEPGRPFHLGVLVSVRENWHVYWKNPGDGGQATKIRLTLPKGFKAGRVEWPVPEKFTQPGDIVGYGYEKQVMFRATITPPRELPREGGAKLGASVSWLVCHDVCIPGSAEDALDLPVAEKSTPANQEVFARWADLYPLSPDSARFPLDVVVEGEIENGRSGSFVVKIVWKDPPARVEWFPTAQNALAIQDVAITTQERKTEIRFSALIFKAMKLTSPRLETVVAYTDQKGKRRGVIVPVLLLKKPQAK